MVVAHNITAEEVRGWSRGRHPWSDDLCGEIAERLNKMPWPSDPPREPGAPRPKWSPPPPPDDPLWEQRVDAQLREQAAAAKVKAPLDKLRTCGGDRVKAASDPLVRALLEIEFPFGYGQALVELSQTIQGMPSCEAEAHLRKLGLPPDTIKMLVENTPEQLDRTLLQMARERRRRRLKRRPPPQWHMPAFVIAQKIGEVLTRRGLPVSKSRNSIFVRVVRKAMRRMGHLDIKAMVGEGAIAQCLDRHSVMTPEGLRLRLKS